MKPKTNRLRKRYIKGPAVLIDRRPEPEIEDPTTVRIVLRVPREFHYELKVYAAVHRLTMTEALQQGFEGLKKTRK